MDKNPQVSKAPPLFQLMNPKGQTVLSKVVWKAGWGGEGTRVEGTFLGLIIKVSTGLKKAECIYNLEWRHKKEQQRLLAWCLKNTVRVSGMKQYEMTQYGWNK